MIDVRRGCAVQSLRRVTSADRSSTVRGLRVIAGCTPDGKIVPGGRLLCVCCDRMDCCPVCAG